MSHPVGPKREKAHQERKRIEQIAISALVWLLIYITISTFMSVCTSVGVGVVVAVAVVNVPTVKFS